MGSNGIGWNGFREQGAGPTRGIGGVRRELLLREGLGRRGRVFAE
jgi:hypothetical protein